jgi:superfamily I DNA/RNA helicase
MKFLLFDLNAIATYVGDSTLQSVEYLQGDRLVQHFCGKLNSEIFEGTVVEYTDDGIIFLGKATADTSESKDNVGHPILCYDLTQCNIMSEHNNSTLLTIFQKSFRTALKIWNKQPFSFSERIHGSKSILFPFVFPDPRRLVIERSINVLQMDKRGISFPLLAYKYNAEEPSAVEDTVKTQVIKAAGKLYASKYYELQRKLSEEIYHMETDSSSSALYHFKACAPVGRNDFIFWPYEQQYCNLTNVQKEVVDSDDLTAPLRVDGAAGTGKTMSLLMRAYRLLLKYEQAKSPFRIIFFTHSQSTCQRNLSIFKLYEHGELFLDENSQQCIQFVTLLDFCANFTNLPIDTLVDRDAGDAKSYQLMLIENVVQKFKDNNVIRTYRPILSSGMQDVLDSSKTSPSVLYAMLQHEFSIQIKGRTDSRIDTYYEIPPIANGLPCSTKKDKEFVFLIFQQYQEELKTMGSFDVDDVTLEALSHLNAPVWRRERVKSGYDYILVDEMHLFNINEQSVFFYLTKDTSQKDIPICFALDYSQAIGDRGDIDNDDLDAKFGRVLRKKRYQTVFRNSPEIAHFCASLIASGTLMFLKNFSDPYRDLQSSFTHEEEKRSERPILYLYNNDEDMIKSIRTHVCGIVKDLQCKHEDIAVITFEDSLLSDEGFSNMRELTSMDFIRLDSNRSDLIDQKKDKKCILTSPYVINGLEFKAVILLGVDEGRVPQTMGTSDISQHFIKYSAYNLLYLSASRAKYRLTLLANRLKGYSSCLEHSIRSGNLDIPSSD